VTEMVTGCSFLFGGDKRLGEATTDEMTGGTSTTVTEVLQVLLLPDPSMAVQVTGVEPKPNTPAPVQLAVTPGQLSASVGATARAAPPGPGHGTACGAGQVRVGAW